MLFVGWLFVPQIVFAIAVLASSLGVRDRNRIGFVGGVSLLMLDRGSLRGVAKGVAWGVGGGA